MVSIIIPTYNREKKIIKSLNSILNQTVRDLEVIVVDDGSTDKTQELIEKINDERVIYVKQQNSGACSARNRGIDLAKGEYIAFNDSDDVWHSDKLEKQLEKMQKHEVDIVFCKYRRMQNEKCIEIAPRIYREGKLNPVKNLFGIGTQTIIGKSYIFKENKFDENMPRLQELEVLLRLAEKYKIYCLDEPLVDYEMGQDSISRNPMKLYKASQRIMQKYPDLKQKYPQIAKELARGLVAQIDYVEKHDKKFIIAAWRCGFSLDLCMRIVYHKIRQVIRKM